MSKKICKTSKPAVQTKGKKIRNLLQRNTGAKVAELANATGWQQCAWLYVGDVEEEAVEITISREENKDRRYVVEGRVQ